MFSQDDSSRTVCMGILTQKINKTKTSLKNYQVWQCAIAWFYEVLIVSGQQWWPVSHNNNLSGGKDSNWLQKNTPMLCSYYTSIHFFWMCLREQRENVLFFMVALKVRRHNFSLSLQGWKKERKRKRVRGNGNWTDKREEK